jgi:hypothetical protein
MPPEGDDALDPKELYESLDDPSGADGQEGTDGPADAATDAESGTDDQDSVETDDDADTEDPDDGEAVDSIENIETIVVEPDDVVELMAHNGREGELAKGKGAFVLSPPYHERMEPSIRYLDSEALSEVDADDVRLRPLHFVREGKGALEQRPTRTLAHEKLDDDPDEATVDEWLEAAMAEWEEYVRENLLGMTQVFSPHGMVVADVEYEG